MTIYGPSHSDYRLAFCREIVATVFERRSIWFLADFNVVRLANERQGKHKLSEQKDFNDLANRLAVQMSQFRIYYPLV